MFVNLIDEMTPWHIRILQFFQNPEGYGREKGMTPDILRMGAPAILLEPFYPISAVMGERTVCRRQDD